MGIPRFVVLSVLSIFAIYEVKFPETGVQLLPYHSLRLA